MGTTLKKGQSCHVSAKTQNRQQARPDFHQLSDKTTEQGEQSRSMERQDQSPASGICATTEERGVAGLQR